MNSTFRTTLGVLGLGFGAFVAEALYSGNEKFYREWVIPLGQKLIPDCERAHNLAVYACGHGFIPRRSTGEFPQLRCQLFGLDFDHPVGLAAGFDKNGEAVTPLLSAGFSHVEVGTITPNPQFGNPRPRMFRWKDKEAVINRCGFNNDGHDAVYERLKNRQWNDLGIVGINLGCNKSSADPVLDYVMGVRKFGQIADYLVINVSSPNTAGLRTLQTRDKLHDLLTRVLTERDKLPKRTPILLKISPDESDAVLKDIVDVSISPKTQIDGMIISNTTLASYEQAVKCGAVPIESKQNVENPNYGGLSGPPLLDKSTTCLAKVHAMTKGRLPLIGVGGISNGEDAERKLAAGASLVQLYTSFIYQGPPVAHRIARELNELRHPLSQTSGLIDANIKDI